MFTSAAFSKVAARSGLSKGEVAKLYGVSRPTVYAWLAGTLPRNEMLGRIADTITLALQNSIDKKILPLPAMDAQVRAGKVEKMRVILQKLTPAVR